MAGDTDKRTNEIGTIIPLLETLPDIEGRTITADALLTQRALATYLVDRGAHCLSSPDRRRKIRTNLSCPDPGPGLHDDPAAAPDLLGSCGRALDEVTLPDIGEPLRRCVARPGR